MDIASLFFLSLSLCVIIFNVCLLYFSYKDIKRRRQELREYKEQLLAELERVREETNQLIIEAKEDKGEDEQRVSKQSQE
jgi:hypothetical protein